MKSKVIKRICFHLFIFGLIALLLWLYYFFGISCPIKKFIHIPCPTCGMTRSMIALFRGDIRLSLYYHALTIPSILLLWFAFHQKLFKISKLTKNIIIISGAVIIFGYYIYRLIFGLIP